MKKICHLSSVHRALDTRIFLKECSSLGKYYQVTLIAKHDKMEKLNGIDVIPFPLLSNRLLRILISPIFMLFLALKNRAELYHIHDPELMFLVIPLRLLGAEVIFDSHEHLKGSLHSKDYLNNFVIQLIQIGYKFIEKFILPSFTAIVAATPAIMEELIKFNKNTILVNNYPILTEFNNVSTWSKKERTICYIGGITKIRGIEQVLNSLDDLDVTFSLAGCYDSVSFKRELAQHRNWFKVVEYGFVDREKMASIMKRSVGGMVLFSKLPNHVNAQPNKIFEYMSASLPVIGSDFSLWREIIVDNNCGLCVNPDDTKAIRKAIICLINNKELAEKMGENGRKSVEEKYNWKKEEKKLFKLYADLLK